MTLPVYERPKQEVPQQILTDLLRCIRGQFCPDMPAKEWFQSQRFFIRILTYPAAWLNQRGVTLPPARYKVIILSIFDEVKHHGKTGEIRYFPGYLLKVVQEHFAHHGEEYYEEGKAIRSTAERALFSLTNLPRVQDPVSSLAAAHAATVSALRAGRPSRSKRGAPAQALLPI